MYPVQFCLEDANFAVQLAEIRDWLNKHRIDPGVLRYRLGADNVVADALVFWQFAAEIIERMADCFFGIRDLGLL